MISMKSYTNLEQRMAHTYLDMFPPFVPLANGEVSVHSQEQFYRFVSNVYQSIFDTPEILFTTTYEDDAYPNRFNRASYGKPKLYNLMKKLITEIDGLMAWFFTLGQSGALKDGKLVFPEAIKGKKKHIQVLPHLALKLEGDTLSCEAFDGLFPAWKWMAKQGNLTAFGRSLFDPQYPYMQAIYARLLGDAQAFSRLAAYLEVRGYRRVETERGPHTLDYVKRTVEADVSLGNPIAGDPHHYGISAEYTPYTAVPQFLVLRILEMKNLLLKFDQMEPSLKDFVIQYAKKCDHCRYCTQTDKTGKRKELAISVIHNGEYHICPLYPGFNFCFSTLDETMAQNLMSFLDFMEKHLSGELSVSANWQKEIVR
jgi:hypothetical protein